MSDRRTLKGQILAEIHKTGVDDDVDRAIIESIRFNRRFSFWFNTGPWSVTTTQGIYSYDLPADYLGLIGPVYFTLGTDANSRRRLGEMTSDQAEGTRFTTSSPSGINTGNPQVSAVEDGKLLLIPIPNHTGDTADGRYTKDLGTPSYTYSGSAWSFLAPDGSALSATYTNGWFTNGQDLTRTRAVYYLYNDVYNDPGRAQPALGRWLEAQAGLRSETNRRRHTRTIRPYLT